MFSDYSLKALIGNWSEEYLGPNPFKKISETEGNVNLRFHAYDLTNSDSEQLKKVGELCNDGIVNINCLGGTIV